MFGRNKVAKLVAEFLGTGLLTLLVLSVQRSTIGVPFFVAIAAGLTVAVLVVVFGRISGAHLNPAVTVALWTARQVRTLEAAAYIAVQLLGAWVVYYLYTYLTDNKFQPIGGHYDSRILVAEAIGGIILGLAWAAVVYGQMLNSVKAALVGAAYMLAIVAASVAAIGLVNPALALGARAWVWGTYVLGPVLGTIIGVNLYGLLFAPVNAFARPVRATRVAAPAATKVTTKTVTAKKTTAKKKTTRKK
jgi:glycerol uptake facilitator-like aquaporin